MLERDTIINNGRKVRKASEQKLTETAWELWFEEFCTCSRDVNWMDKRVDELGSGMCRSREIHRERKKAAGWSGKGLHTCQWNLGNRHGCLCGAVALVRKKNEQIRAVGSEMKDGR